MSLRIASMLLLKLHGCTRSASQLSAFIKAGRGSGECVTANALRQTIS